MARNYPYSHSANPNTYRRDTAPILPDYGLDEFYASLTDQARNMRIFTEQERQRQEREYLDATNVPLDPNLSDPDFQKWMLKDLEKFEQNNMEQVKEYGYNLPMEEKLKVRNATNLLKQRQSALLMSQNLHDQAIKQMRENPELYDKEAFELLEKEFRTEGKPILSWLELRGNDPDVVVGNKIRELLDFQESKTTEEGGVQTTQTRKWIENMTPGEIDGVMDEMLKNPATMKGAVKRWQNDPDSQKYQNASQWFKEKYRGEFERKMRASESSQPVTKTGGDSDMWWWGSDNKNDPMVSYNPHYLQGEGGLGGYNLGDKPIKMEAMRLPEELQGIDQGTQDVLLSGIRYTDDGRMVIEAYYPKPLTMTEEEINEAYPVKIVDGLDQNRWERLQLLKGVKGSKDAITVNRLFLPFKPYQDVLKRNYRFDQSPQKLLLRMTAQGIFQGPQTKVEPQTAEAQGVEPPWAPK